MIQLEKRELEPILLMIASIDPKTGKVVGGLLTENLTLGTKRVLQKIRSKLLEEYKTFLEEVDAVREECGEDKEKLEKEFEVLFKEKVKVPIDKFKMSHIENVSSTSVYDFELLEKISQ